MTTIVTMQLDAASQAAFDLLREAHYPQHLNRIAAHLTLFHALPDTKDIREALLQNAQFTKAFDMQAASVMSLGRGVAYAISSPELMSIHASLTSAFSAHLIPQDRQKFRPHIVVQNKVMGNEARNLCEELNASFKQWTIRAEGIQWWNYLGGPWELRESFRFVN